MPKNKFRILSLSGGGLRAVSSVAILVYIEKKLGKPIQSKFDLIAGTSTGGIIACALGIGMTPQQILHLYIKRGKDIFPHKNEAISNATNVFSPKYCDKGLDKVLREFLGEKKMSDLSNDILVPSYDLNSSQPLFFKSRRKKEYDFKLYDICRATSAAPTYLPSYEFCGFNCIDGGLFCNNPSLAAISEVIKHYSDYGLESDNEDNIYLLSIGTGTYKQKISPMESKNKGQLFWAKKAPDIMMQGVSSTTDYEVKEILPAENYLYLNIDIKDEKYSNMDDSSEDTMNWLLEQTTEQIINNDLKNKEIDRLMSLL